MQSSPTLACAALFKEAITTCDDTYLTWLKIYNAKKKKKKKKDQRLKACLTLQNHHFSSRKTKYQSSFDFYFVKQ